MQKFLSLVTKDNESVEEDRDNDNDDDNESVEEDCDNDNDD